jgi:hypothetical protein
MYMNDREGDSARCKGAGWQQRVKGRNVEGGNILYLYELLGT